MSANGRWWRVIPPNIATETPNRRSALLHVQFSYSPMRLNAKSTGSVASYTCSRASSTGAHWPTYLDTIVSWEKRLGFERVDGPRKDKV